TTVALPAEATGPAAAAAALEAIADVVEARVLERLGDLSAQPEWLSVESAAVYLDVSPERVRKLVARRALPYYQDGIGCRVFLRRRELDEWMSRTRIAAMGDGA
ncbi:MAG: helix-turn-helix domain-containing protein, partial [Actinobacteria bacterium]|nr:helix-turn-helix domain-containing protein [Actinomycetota bacterium]